MERKTRKIKIAEKKQKVALIPLNGVVIKVPYTSFMGMRYDEDYGSTFVYLLENKGRKVLHEFHVEVPMVTKDIMVSKRDLRTLKRQISEYDSEQDECGDCEIGPNRTKKQTFKTEYNSDMSMYG